MKKLLILGALYEEVEPLIRKWGMSQNPGSPPVWTKKNETHHVQVTYTGIGEKKCVRFLSGLDDHQFDMIFVVGTSGGCYPDCKTGDFILPRLTYDKNSETPLLYEPPVDLYPQPLMTGRHYTADVFLPGREKEALYNEQGVYTVDMEWAFILRYCLENHIPVFYCKVIADELHTTPPPFRLMRYHWKDLPWKKMIWDLKRSPVIKIQQYIHALRFSGCLRKATDRSAGLAQKIIKKID